MEPKAYRSLYSLVTSLMTVMAVAITIIVDQELWYYTYYYGSSFYAYDDVCFMEGPKADNINVCYYTWSITAVGIFLSLFLFFLLSCGGNSHRTGWYVGSLSFMLIWWLAGAIVDTIYIVDANDAGVDKENYRNAVMGLLWGCVFLNIIALFAAISDHKQNKNWMPPPPPQAQFMGGPPGGAPYPGAGMGAPYGAPPPPQYYPAPGQAPYGAPPPAAYPPGTAQGYPAAGPPAGYPAGSSPVWTNK